MNGEDVSSQMPLEPPGLQTWQTVHVRNTFIEVDEGDTEPRADPVPSTGANPLGRTWRRGHLRCASEPMSSFFARSPWEPMSLATSSLGEVTRGALQSQTLEAMLDVDRLSPPQAERGRVSTSLGANLTRSQSYVSPIRESQEYEALRRFHFPKYIGVHTGTDFASPWRGEPMMVEVPSHETPDARERQDAYNPTHTNHPNRAHTLACPVRFRHARQRSRTIQEDKELVDAQTLDELDVQGQLAQSSWDFEPNVNFRVRNTFIEVDEGSESCADAMLSPQPWRPSHLRCASEPIQTVHSSVNSYGFPPEGHLSGFHSRTSSYQADDAIEHIAEVIQAQPHQLQDACESKRPSLVESPQPMLPPDLHLEQALGRERPDPRAQNGQRRQLQPVFLTSNDGFTHPPNLPAPTASSSTAASTPAKTSQCKWHMRGACKYGTACRFSHEATRNPGKKAVVPTVTDGVAMPANGPLPAGLLPGPLPVGPHAAQAKPQTPGPVARSAARCRSASPVSTTAGSSAGEDSGACQRNASEGRLEKPHQVFWCDARAFKQEFQGLREQLETCIGMAAKSHKTAEKCMRLLKKKQRVRAERGRSVQKARPLVFLVSWANAQELVNFLKDAMHMPPVKVVVLCDTNGPKTRAAAERWSKEFPVVERVAATWPEAVQVVSDLLSKSFAPA